MRGDLSAAPKSAATATLSAASLSSRSPMAPRTILARWDRRALAPRISMKPNAMVAQRTLRSLPRSPQVEVLSTVAINIRAQRGGSKFAHDLAARPMLAARPTPLKQVELDQATSQTGAGAIGIDEVWEEVRRLGDNRPEAIQDIVDDYRSALLDEDSETDTFSEAGAEVADS